MKRIPMIFATAAAVFLAGCASQSGSAYSRNETLKEMSVRQGVIESVRQVSIEGTQTGAGTIAGGAIGGIAGSNVGKGKGSTVGAILGVVGGAVAGSLIEGASTKKNGVEITVKLDNGSLVAITQEGDEPYRPGERVRILSDGRTSRVSH